MPRAEKAPQVNETLLSRKDRDSLLRELIPIARNQQIELFWGDERFTEIMTIGAYLMDKKFQLDTSLNPAVRTHLQKMAALESRKLPADHKNESSREFWEAIKEATGPWWGIAQNLPPGLSHLPKELEAAFNDLVRIGFALRGDEE